MVRYLSIDSRLEGRRLNRVGIVGSKLYLEPMGGSSIEIWSVDSLYPSSWTQLLNIPFHNLIYSVPSCSYSSPFIYIWAAGIENEDENIFTLAIYKLNYNTGEFKKYFYDPMKCVPLSMDIPYETLTMRCDDKNVVMFDRSIVMGSLPFWEVHFEETSEENTFYLIRNDINSAETEEDSVGHCTRFPIPFDAPNRIFGRLKDNSSMMIYQPESEKWVEYEMVNGGRMDFEIPPVSVRGLRESYGRHGRRLGAVETPLTFHCDGKKCIVRVVVGDKHRFYDIVLDHSKRQFTCSQRGDVKLRGGVDKMFYTLCTDSLFAFIGIREIAIVPLQPPRLQEASLWRIQRHFNRNQQFLEDGLDEREIKQLCKEVYEAVVINAK